MDRGPSRTIPAPPPQFITWRGTRRTDRSGCAYVNGIIGGTSERFAHRCRVKLPKSSVATKAITSEEWSAPESRSVQGASP